MSARAQRQAQTDPSEVAPLNAIFWRWGLRASEAWNISGEPCGGAAIDNTDIDNNPNFNPAIKVRLLLQHQHSLPHHQDESIYTKCGWSDSCGTAKSDLPDKPGFSAELLDWIFASVSWKAHSVAVSIFGNQCVNWSFTEGAGYIDSCGLSGELPSTFSKLKNLKTLWASDNEFTGKIPDYIGSLSNLTDLRLHGNYFDGPIPASFSNLVNLKNLRIGDLMGEVSLLAFVVNMTSLSTLVLRNSRISDNLASVDFSKFLTSIIWT
ncbi:unnamed protein product [Triticum turgidum subsp. durum]|uniref:Leucine-rich repeat-containing N-terminal plant-type domain-containing protein n=1 Tax=Triticum turgidum subsp. durum TaxID=4567 RepID=A0A9R1QTY9_TRITD|nr:unnamed protein product [Triticum turgidum subsp. durum]